MPILEKITEGLLYPLPWVSYVILLFFLVTCCIISTWIATILLKKPLRKNVIAFLLSLFAALAIIEGFMVATGFMATYLEERGLGRPLVFQTVPLILIQGLFHIVEQPITTGLVTRIGKKKTNPFGFWLLAIPLPKAMVHQWIQHGFRWLKADF